MGVENEIVGIHQDGPDNNDKLITNNTTGHGRLAGYTHHTHHIHHSCLVEMRKLLFMLVAVHGVMMSAALTTSEEYDDDPDEEEPATDETSGDEEEEPILYHEDDNTGQSHFYDIY
jgi:hypothetical protein